MFGMNVKYSAKVSFEQVERAAPPGYRRAVSGETKAPGLYGEGMGGEPLVVLLTGDDGKWFDALVE